MSQREQSIHNFNYKNGVLIIEAFRARIDKSKVIEFRKNLAQKYEKSCQSTRSPYFTHKSSPNDNRID